MPPITRVVLLGLIGRLRALGWMPWLVLLLWAAAAAAGEPRLFRAYGIHIRDQALWGGAAVLVVLVGVSAEIPRSALTRQLVGLLGLAGIALVQGALAGLMEVAAGTSPQGLAAMVGKFALSTAPLAVVGSTPAPTDRGWPLKVAHLLVWLGCAAATGAALVRASTGSLDARCIAGLALSIASCALLVACSESTAMISRRR